MINKREKTSFFINYFFIIVTKVADVLLMD